MALPLDRAGEGPAILLLHAGIADRTMWREHLDPLAQTGHEVVAVDLPGFGEAAAEGASPVAHWEDVRRTMDELAIERAAVVGSSFGAAVALRLAAVHPERVSALLLFSSPAAPEPEPSPTLLAVWEAEEEALERGAVDAAVEAVLAGWIPADAPEEVRRRVAVMQRRNVEKKLAAPDQEQAPDPIEADPGILARIDAPALAAFGAGDMEDFERAADELRQRLAQTVTTVVPGAAHLAPLEAPTEFRRLVTDNLPAA